MIMHGQCQLPQQPHGQVLVCFMLDSCILSSQGRLLYFSMGLSRMTVLTMQEIVHTKLQWMRMCYSSKNRRKTA